MRSTGIFAVAVLAALPALAQEVAVPPSAGGQALTIYNSDVALVRDRRAVDARQGQSRLAFDGISRVIQAESVVLRGDGIRLLESVFDRNTLTTVKLLQHWVGREVTVKRWGVNGADESRRGTLVGIHDGAHVLVDGKIERIDGSMLAFDGAPEGVRQQPTLVAAVEAEKPGRRDIELAYLTTGLNWRADYVVDFNEAAGKIDMEVLATVTNNTGIAYPDARVAFAAGDINRVPVEQVRNNRMVYEKIAMPSAAPMSGEAPREAMAGAYLYRLDRPTTLGVDQIKQVSLLLRRGVPVQRRYVAEAPGPIAARVPDPHESNATLLLVLVNDKASGLDLPLPAGIARVYRRDSKGDLQFQGEDRVRHTAAGAEVRLTLGRDFDLPVKRVQTSFTRVSSDVSESAYEVTVRNAKPEAVTVTVKEQLPGDWQMLEESKPHKKETSQTAAWDLAVPAGGQAVLRYRIRAKGY